MLAYAVGNYDSRRFFWHALFILFYYDGWNGSKGSLIRWHGKVDLMLVLFDLVHNTVGNKNFLITSQSISTRIMCFYFQRTTHNPADKHHLSVRVNTHSKRGNRTKKERPSHLGIPLSAIWCFSVHLSVNWRLRRKIIRKSHKIQQFY